jgi:hypothetical protein
VEGRLAGNTGGLEFVDDFVAECAHRVHLTLRHIAHTVGVEGDDLVRILGGRNADGADAAHVADVAVGLGVEVDEGTDEVEIGVLVRSMLIGLR